MQAYGYTVWLADTSTDEERAVGFNVLASSKDGALEWGDKITRRMSARRKALRVVKSEIADLPRIRQSAATVVYGHYPDDAQIGW